MDESSPQPSNWTELVESVYKAHATRPVAKRLKWRGLDISIENPQGSVRSGVDADGTPWETTMPADYGYFKRTESPGDGDHYDVFVDGEPCADPDEVAYVIHTVVPGTDKYDEDKIILGAPSAAAAYELFAAAYDQPENHFGAISAISGEALARFLGAGRENWGKKVVPRAPYKIHLQRRQATRLAQINEEAKRWKRALVQAEKARCAQTDPDEVPDQRPELRAIGRLRHAQRTLQREVGEMAVQKALGAANYEVLSGGEWAGRRVIKIQPSWEVVDVKNEFVAKSTMREAWPYYEQCGNVDLEHLTRKGGKTLEDYAATLYREGFPVADALEKYGRSYFEIGRPIAGSFHEEDCWFLAEIYVGNPVADWFWDTLTRQSPALPWKPSVAGACRYVDAVVSHSDPAFGIKNLKQGARVMKSFPRWNNVGLTIEPVNHWVPPVEVVPTSPLLTPVSKGTELMPDYTAADVLKTAMLRSAQLAVNDMIDSEQIDELSAARMLATVTKAIDAVQEEGDLLTEVSKALDYGVVSLDRSDLTQGGAASYSALSPLKKHRIADEVFEYTLKGVTPFQEGFEFTRDLDEETGVEKAMPQVDVGDYVMQEYGCDSDDALEIADLYLRRVLQLRQGQ